MRENKKIEKIFNLILLVIMYFFSWLFIDVHIFENKLSVLAKIFICLPFALAANNIFFIILKNYKE